MGRPENLIGSRTSQPVTLFNGRRIQATDHASIAYVHGEGVHMLLVCVPTGYSIDFHGIAREPGLPGSQPSTDMSALLDQVRELLVRSGPTGADLSVIPIPDGITIVS